MLPNKTVTQRKGDGDHPERNHRGKVERSDTCDDSERLATVFAENSPGNFEFSAFVAVLKAECELDDFDAFEEACSRFRECFSRFPTYRVTQALQVTK